MRTWLLLLAPMGIWAAHFLGVYGIASVFDVAARADVPLSRATVGAFTLACATADLLLLRFALRRPETGDDVAALTRTVAATGAGFSLAAVLWQGLPALVGH